MDHFIRGFCKEAAVAAIPRAVGSVARAADTARAIPRWFKDTASGGQRSLSHTREMMKQERGLARRTQEIDDALKASTRSEAVETRLANVQRFRAEQAAKRTADAARREDLDFYRAYGMQPTKKGFKPYTPGKGGGGRGEGGRGEGGRGEGGRGEGGRKEGGGGRGEGGKRKKGGNLSHRVFTHYQKATMPEKAMLLGAGAHTASSGMQATGQAIGSARDTRR